MMQGTHSVNHSILAYQQEKLGPIPTVSNPDLNLKKAVIFGLSTYSRNRMTFIWVRGYSGVECNEKVDDLTRLSY